LSILPERKEALDAEEEARCEEEGRGRRRVKLGISFRRKEEVDFGREFLGILKTSGFWEGSGF
jgi:hypothetical protein